MRWATKDFNTLFVEPERTTPPKGAAPPSYVRKTFRVDRAIASASIHLSACGLYRAFINGLPVTEQVFLPGFTDYRYRLQYQTFDVGHHLSKGENVIGVVLGDGWYRGKQGLLDLQNVYGDKIKLLAYLTIQYTDGTTGFLHTDPSWKATQQGPLRMSDLKDGASYDATLEMQGWQFPGFDDTDWHAVLPSSYAGALIPTEGVPIREKEAFQPTILTTPKGQQVLDFGQNLAGYVRFVVKGPKGHTVKLTHGETLDENGNFTLQHLKPRGRFQEIHYTLKDGHQSFQPCFTLHGFRYVWLENWPTAVQAKDFTALAVYSDLKPVGEFHCSNPQINQLFSNIKWSQKSNYVDVPTDCPTRERGTWTGDFAVFFKAGCYLMESNAFAQKWLNDLLISQQPNGLVATHIPSQGYEKFTRYQGSCGWGDAAVIIPYDFYEMYGDVAILERHYKSMKRWVDYLCQKAQRSHWTSWLKRNPYRAYTLDTGFHFGEWNEPNSSMAQQQIKNLLFPDAEFATAYFAHAVDLVAKVADILQQETDRERYRALFKKIKQAYQYNFTTNGIIHQNRDAKYVRPVFFELIDAPQRKENIQILNDRIVANGYQIGTGFLSTPFLLPVLCDYGYVDTAYKMLENDRSPSWLYSVRKGATTIWESWEGLNEQGVPKDSLNHYSYGAVVSWLFNYCAGIKPLLPGFQKIQLKPYPGGSLKQVHCRFKSPSGPIAVTWELDQGFFNLQISVPVETVVSLPDGTTSRK